MKSILYYLGIFCLVFAVFSCQPPKPDQPQPPGPGGPGTGGGGGNPDPNDPTTNCKDVQPGWVSYEAAGSNIFKLYCAPCHASPPWNGDPAKGPVNSILHGASVNFLKALKNGDVIMNGVDPGLQEDIFDQVSNDELRYVAAYIASRDPDCYHISGKSMPGSTVVAAAEHNPGASAIVEADGSWEIRNLVPGDYVILPKKPLYKFTPSQYVLTLDFYAFYLNGDELYLTNPNFDPDYFYYDNELNNLNFNKWQFWPEVEIPDWEEWPIPPVFPGLKDKKVPVKERIEISKGG